jgi:hypothetical protein
MSALNQILERRRAAEVPTAQPCHSNDAQPASLLVTTPAGESWVFPWHHLTSARLAVVEDRGELQLVFTSHKVTLRGFNLTPLRDLVATVRLATIRPAPTKYTKSAGDEPFIDSVEVTAVPSPRDASAAKGSA